MKAKIKQICFYISAAIIVAFFIACSDLGERDIVIPATFTIRFNSLGGTPVDSISGFEDRSITLPATSFLGWDFEGWYSKAEDGEFIGMPGEKYTISENRTMFARWESILPKDRGDSVIYGIVSVFVEAGTFMMGSPEDEDGRKPDETQREITLTRSFWISKYPITNRQFGGNFAEGAENYPAVNITWQEAYDFAKSRGGFLPTEAQWEFAARGGNKSRGYIFSGSNNLSEVGWYENNSGGRLREVGLKNPNELGIFDMSGNVFEWVYDLYDNEEGRICRGGSWISPSSECRVAERPFAIENSRFPIIGFRIAFWAE